MIESDEGKTTFELAQEKYDALRVIVSIANRLAQWDDADANTTEYEVLMQLYALIKVWAGKIGLDITTNFVCSWDRQEATLANYQGEPFNYIKQEVKS